MMTEREKAIYCLALAAWNPEIAAEQANRWRLDPTFVDRVLETVIEPEVKASMEVG